jgi:hypothetical protein
MQGSLRTSSDGRILAPNLFTLSLPLDQANAINSDQVFIDGLARNLEQAALENGIYFPSQPTIKVVAKTESNDNSISVNTEFSLEHLGETTTMDIQSSETQEITPENAFLIVDGARIFPLTSGLVNIGRNPDNQLIIDDPSVSRHHAQLRSINRRYIVFDLNSTGGTFVNGRQVSKHVLIPGDLISLAGIPLVFGQEGAKNDEKTQELGILSDDTSEPIDR